MERRNRSLRALENLRYIDSLDSGLRAKKLLSWMEEYAQNNGIEDFDLPLTELHQLSELFYKNILFLKDHTNELKSQLNTNTQIKKFFN